MSEDEPDAIAALFAPEGGWRVRILDLSGANLEDDDVVETVAGFPTVIAANAFARAYVRDSIELCRAPGMGADDVLAAWTAFGEDAEVVDAGQAGWSSTDERARFAADPAGRIERDWRSLDPRREDADAGGDGDGDEAEDASDAEPDGADPLGLAPGAPAAARAAARGPRTRSGG